MAEQFLSKAQERRTKFIMGTLEELGLGAVEAAKKRIEICERFGMEIDPRDVEIVEAAQ